MPTGYTQGILDGTTATFKDFASLCMRAFGATVHMRDEGLDVEYRPAGPGPYHRDQLEKLKADLEGAESRSPESFYRDQLEAIKRDILYREKKISEKKIQRAKLEDMLHRVRQWTPPTADHVNFKDFMQSQLKDTIQWDGDLEGLEEELVKLKTSLTELESGQRTPEDWGAELKAQTLSGLQRQTEYHLDLWNEDQKRCNDRNQWVQTLLDSID